MSSKACKDCGEEKPLDDYSSLKTAKDGKRSVCKKCDVKRVQAYRKANREKYLASVKLYNEKSKEERSEKYIIYRVKNKEKISKRTKVWRESNKEHIKRYAIKYVEDNKDKVRANSRRWYLENKNKVNLYGQLRRTRVRELRSDLTPTQEEEIMKVFNHGCALTGDTLNVHLDHVIPVSIGHGGTTIGNVIPLRGDLNSSKNNANIFEWFEANRQRFELDKNKFDNLIQYLAQVNSVSTEDYRDHVYWCHDNPHYLEDEEVI
jgi:hypothetical protein